jgi:hypothetical protein
MSFIKKNREQKDKTGPDWVMGTSGKEEDTRKVGRRVKMAGIFSTHCR